jgi:hypothetical protein
MTTLLFVFLSITFAAILGWPHQHHLCKWQRESEVIKYLQKDSPATAAQPTLVVVQRGTAASLALMYTTIDR